MATFGIESNGRLEKTAIYFNGEQLGGIKEVFLNLEEDGTCDGIIQYEGTDKQIYTKNIFSDYMTNIKIVEPSFTEEDAEFLNLIEVESDGNIENTNVFYNKENLEGVVGILVHIKATESKEGLSKIFSGNKRVPEAIEFKAEITFRNEDNNLETEGIF